MARVYATLSHLELWLGAAPPSGAERRLERASMLLDQLLIGARYDTDTAGLPTDADVIEAFRSAVCAQVEWWAQIGDDDGTGAAGSWGDVQIGSVRLSRGSGRQAGNQPHVAPAVHRILHAAGLYPLNPTLTG